MFSLYFPFLLAVISLYLWYLPSLFPDLVFRFFYICSNLYLTFLYVFFIFSLSFLYISLSFLYL